MLFYLRVPIKNRLLQNVTSTNLVFDYISFAYLIVYSLSSPEILLFGINPCHELRLLINLFIICFSCNTIRIISNHDTWFKNCLAYRDVKQSGKRFVSLCEEWVLAWSLDMFTPLHGLKTKFLSKKKINKLEHSDITDCPDLKPDLRIVNISDKHNKGVYWRRLEQTLLDVNLKYCDAVCFMHRTLLWWFI